MRHLCILTLTGVRRKISFKRGNVMRHLCVLTLTLIMLPIMLSADSAETALYRTDLSPTFEEPPLQGVSAGGMSNISAVRGKSRHRTVSLDRSMSYGLFCPGTI